MNLDITCYNSKKVYTAPSLLCDMFAGLFTAEEIKQDEFIIEYSGQIIN